jgi:outer membrane protein assembly factor BamB
MRSRLLPSAALALLLAAPAAAQTKRAADNWASFRGPHASGVARAGQNLPDAWDAAKGEGVRWKTRIPGLAHSSPVVWNDRVYVTTAVSSRGNETFRHGIFGDGDASDDRSTQQWKVYALDRRTGKVVWERVAYEGAPREKRHVKATYANATPATDGRYVVAFFGSQGLYAYDARGRLVWKKDLGVLNAGAYDIPSYEWGTASSPVIYQDLVIVQCDTQTESFLLAADIKTGKTVWKTARQELPSWGTPTIYEGGGRTELVTNASNFIRGYDPLTGRELWRLGGSSKITAPTPIFSGDLIVVASGRRPEAPIFVVRAGATGDITLAAGQTSSRSVAWSKQQRGPYMPTPLIYGGHLYVLSNQGVLDCYDLKTGAEVYRQRLPHKGGGFSASPVAADGRLYLPSEDGDIFVVRAGPTYELLSKNPMGELLMATPAISSGTMFVRTQHHVYAVGR